MGCAPWSAAEERAVQMAAECETLREEKDAIAEALDFVNAESEGLQRRAAAAEAAAAGAREEGYRSGFAAVRRCRSTPC